MFYSERHDAVRRLLFRYLDSPSLRHIRDPKSVGRLADDIVNAIDREPTIWRKWEGQRETVLKAAAACWIPPDDLQAFLNSMPGPTLTLTDVQQRLRAMHEEPYEAYPDVELRPSCLALYEREKASGTEMPAIIGALQEHVETEAERLRTEKDLARRTRQQDERIALEHRFLSGADCKWTSVDGSAAVFTRRNGRAYRLEPMKDRRWQMFRIEDRADTGKLIGTYGSRGDANKVLAKLAYEAEPRW